MDKKCWVSAKYFLIMFADKPIDSFWVLIALE